jgi:type I restriction enzyme, S subunit
MELKAGYKQTEVGVIPEDWRYLPITRVARLESGHTPSKRRLDYWGGGISWISLFDTQGLSRNEISTTEKKITAEGLNNSSARLLPAGTVVFSRTATVGKTSIMASPMATSQDFANYICGPDLHNVFLVYLFRSMGRTWKTLMAGSIHNTIYMPTFKALKILVPPLPEQKAIAEVLSDTDALIVSLEQLLTKKLQIKQGAMQELLTGQRRLPGFTSEWMPKQFGELLTIRHGKNQRDVESADGDIPILATGGEIGKSICPLYDKPSVLIGRKGTIDKPQYMDVPFWTVDTLFYSEIHAPNSAKFLFYRFCLVDWRQYNEASGVPSLNAKTIESVEILCPDENEQNSIAFLLDNIDGELAILETKLKKARQLKQGMMQELLSGRIRLV